MAKEIKKRRPTLKQQRFVEKYMETGNATRAVKEVYDVSTDLTARTMGSENLTKPNVMALIKSYAGEAAQRMKQLSKQDSNLSVSLGATKDILDRSGHKAVEKVEHSIIKAEYLWE